MLYRPIGLLPLKASVIGLGTGSFGGRTFGNAEADNAVKIIHTSLDHGINFIDTAPVYGYGLSETIVGKAIRHRRDQVVLATKCGIVWNQSRGEFLTNVNEDGLVDLQGSPIKVLHKCLVPASITEEVEKSLTRLGTDYIDLYQTHWQDATTPIEDTVATLLRLKDQGKIRAIGVSNVSLGQLKKYGGIAADQELFNMLDRNVGKNGILDHCREHQIAFLAYSPLCGKLLTGNAQPKPDSAAGEQETGNPRLRAGNIQRLNAMLDEFRPIAQGHQVNLVQLVTAWTFSQPGVTHVLRSASSEKQAIENAAAGDLALSPDELKTMNAIIGNYTAVIL